MEYLHTTAAFALVALNAYAVTVLAMERRLAAATLLPGSSLFQVGRLSSSLPAMR
jgi:hypothetical protein